MYFLLPIEDTGPDNATMRSQRDVGMEDRRRIERFQLRVPALVVMECQSGRDEVLDLTMRDVSSDGAFLLSSSLLPEGAMVKMEFTLAIGSLGVSVRRNGRARVKVTGKVIRADGNGAAVRFGNRYKITSSGSGFSATS
jgi:hypothetical protein